MRVLNVFGEPFSNGGQEAFTINVLQAIDKNDLSIDFYTPYYCDNEYYRAIIEEYGGMIYEIGLNFMPGKSRLNIIKPLIKFLKQNHYDVVHIHSGSILCLAYSAFAASICHVKKIIVHSHCTNERETIKHFLAKCFTLPLILCCPTDYFACSKEAGKWKFPSFICKHRLKVVKNGIDVNKFCFNQEIRSRIRRELNISDNSFVIGHVGRFSYEKNHEFLIDIFRKIHNRDSQALLLLVGDGELKGKIMERVKQENLSSSVIFYGSCSNVSQLYQAMDCFLFPSKFEGLGIVAIEAQAAGLKILCSDMIPKETEITELIGYMALLDSFEKWAERVQSFKSYHRENTSEVIKEKGYEISDICEDIKQIYSNIER